MTSRTLPPDAIVEQARTLRSSGHYDDAAAIVRPALAAHPAHGTLWHMLGLIERDRQDTAAALAALERAITLLPTSAPAWHALARVRLAAGLPALDAFERARALAPSDGAIYLGRASAQLADGQSAAAIADLATLLHNSPGWLDGQVELAQIRWITGDRAGFCDGFEVAVGSGAGDAAWYAYANTLLRAEQYAQAASVIERMRSVCARSWQIDLMDAIVRSETGDHAGAAALFEGLDDAAHVEVAVRRMRHLLRTGRADEATARGERLVTGPDASHVWPYLSLAWRLTGDDRWRWLESLDLTVATYDLTRTIDIDALAETLRALHRGQSDMVGQSVRGGSQTDGALFARLEPAITALRRATDGAVTAHAEKLQALPADHPVRRPVPRRVRYAGSWSVRLSGSGFHTHHIHPQGWLSSAFYAALPDTADGAPPHAGHLVIGAPPAELGLDLDPLCHIEPRAGLLAIFPSIAWHGTVPFESGERLTAAFDVAAPPG